MPRDVVYSIKAVRDIANEQHYSCFVCLFVVVPADSQSTWVGARLTARMTAGAGGRENSVAVRPPLPRLRPHPPAAG